MTEQHTVETAPPRQMNALAVTISCAHRVLGEFGNRSENGSSADGILAVPFQPGLPGAGTIGFAYTIPFTSLQSLRNRSALTILDQDTELRSRLTDARALAPDVTEFLTGGTPRSLADLLSDMSEDGEIPTTAARLAEELARLAARFGLGIDPVSPARDAVDVALLVRDSCLRWASATATERTRIALRFEPARRLLQGCGWPRDFESFATMIRKPAADTLAGDPLLRALFSKALSNIPFQMKSGGYLDTPPPAQTVVQMAALNSPAQAPKAKQASETKQSQKRAEPHQNASAPVRGLQAGRQVLLEPPPPCDPQELAQIGRFLKLQDPTPLVAMPDPRKVASALDAEFPWLAKVTRRVVADLALSRLGDGAARIRPLLLVGPPGVGKSRYARRLAAALGMPFRSVSATDANGATVLAGAGRGWRSGRPCLAIQAIRDTGVANPLILVDEIDKEQTSDANGRPSSFLLSLLEPETASRFTDAFLLAPCDLSTVAWVLTANDVSLIPAPLRSRLAVVDVPAPPGEAFATILNGVMKDVAVAIGGDAANLPPLPERVLERLEGDFRRDLSVRRLRAAAQRALGEIAFGGDPIAALTDEAALLDNEEGPYAARRIGFFAESAP